MWRPRCLLPKLSGENCYGFPITVHERDRVILSTGHTATVKHVSAFGEMRVGADSHGMWDEWVHLDSIDAVLR